MPTAFTGSFFQVLSSATAQMQTAIDNISNSIQNLTLNMNTQYNNIMDTIGQASYVDEMDTITKGLHYVSVAAEPLQPGGDEASLPHSDIIMSAKTALNVYKSYYLLYINSKSK